jgi:hypothetical protein
MRLPYDIVRYRAVPHGSVRCGTARYRTVSERCFIRSTNTLARELPMKSREMRYVARVLSLDHTARSDSTQLNSTENQPVGQF